MQLTIVPSDNLTIIDGRGQQFDLSGYASLEGLHAVQWKDTKGWVEFINTVEGDFKANQTITDISQFQDIIDAWTYFTAAEDVELAKQPRAAKPVLRKPPK